MFNFKKVIIFSSLLFLISCSVQKRKYQNGYYVNWKHKKTTIASTKEATKNALNSAGNNSVTYQSSGDKPNTHAGVQKKINPFTKKSSLFSKTGEDSCDVLIFKDGSEIRAKVEEVGINEIKYKRCESPSGPMYVTRKSDIFMIKYVNGTKEVFKAPEPVVNSYQAPAPVNSYKSNKYNRVNHPLALPALVVGSISVLVAYIIGVYSLSGSAEPVLLFLPAIIGLIALIIGITALNRIKEQPDVYKGKGMAIPGFIMGLSVLCIFALIGFFWLAFNI